MIRFLPCGDTALAIELGDRVDRRISGLVLALAARVKAAGIAGVVEIVPTFRSLMIHYDPLTVPQSELQDRLAPLLSDLDAAESPGRLWRLPVCYHESLAPDLGEVATRTGLTPDQVVERHSAVTYHVYMVGFLPGFPYLGDLPAELVLPRRENPRTALPAGMSSRIPLARSRSKESAGLVSWKWKCDPTCIGRSPVLVTASVTVS